MTRIVFRKTLSANDVGATGGHQGGVLIPKGEGDLLEFLPPLDPKIKNPDAWLSCIDEDSFAQRFRFVYYNNKLHDPKGTRNEYRLTYMTAWFRKLGAREGDTFEIAKQAGNREYLIRVIAATSHAAVEQDDGPVRLQLRGWRRVH